MGILRSRWRVNNNHRVIKWRLWMMETIIRHCAQTASWDRLGETVFGRVSLGR